MNSKNIKDVTVAVTYRCNSHCKMCNIWKNNDFSDEIKPKDFFYLPKQLSNINITGGEPFLRRDLTDIIESILINCRWPEIVISTNGLATSSICAQAEKIFKINPDIGVAVSIDGIGSSHDRIRGVKGGYDRALASIKHLKKLNIKNLKVAFTLGDYNVSELKKVYRLAKNFNAEFSLAITHSSNNYFNKQNEMAKRDEMAGVLDWLIKEELSKWGYKNWGRAYFAYGARQFVKTGKRILPDYSGKLNIFIDPYGNVYPNNISDKKIGRLHNIGEGLEFADAMSENWMMCTARAAKKHVFKAGWWFLKNKTVM